MKILNTIFLFILTASLSSQTPEIIVDDLLVNDRIGKSISDQNSSASVYNINGDYLIAWSDNRDNNYDIYAALFNKDGTIKDINFQINDDISTSIQRNPTVAALANGNFIICWEDNRNGNNDIYAQIITAIGESISSNFKVNDDSNYSNQFSPKVSSDSISNFIIVWQDYRNGDSDIYMQKFSSEAIRIGDNIKVNDNTRLTEREKPSIAVAKNGETVICWEENINTVDIDIYFQLFNSNGEAVGLNRKIENDYGTKWQYNPSVSYLSDGTFVIAWDNGAATADTEGEDILMQHYNNNGEKLGKNTKLGYWQYGFHQLAIKSYKNNVFITFTDGTILSCVILKPDGNCIASNSSISEERIGTIGEPAISIDPSSGNYLVTWTDERIGTKDIFLQRYNNNFEKVGKNELVNDDIGELSDQNDPEITKINETKIAVVWEDGRNGEYDTDIYMQVLQLDGVKYGGNIKVNDNENFSIQYNPAISSSQNGFFVIVWEDYRNNNSDIYGQLFNENGQKIGGNFKVNKSPKCYTPDVAMDENGNFVVVWDSRNDYSIYSQKYLPNAEAYGEPLKINDTEILSNYANPSISMNQNGDYVVAWADARDWNANGYDIYAQAISSNQEFIRGNTRVNDDANNKMQFEPNVSLNDSGRFVIVWNDERNGGGNPSIFAQVFDIQDGKIGENFLAANDSLASSPSVSLNENGDFIISFEACIKENNYIPIIFCQLYDKYLVKQGNSFRITNQYNGFQENHSFIFDGYKLLNVWSDTRSNQVKWDYDIWFNLLNVNFINSITNYTNSTNESFYLNIFPNPCNASLIISYHIPYDSNVSIKLFNILGQEIVTFFNCHQFLGDYKLSIDFKNISSGLYFLCLNEMNYSHYKKIIVIK